MCMQSGIQFPGYIINAKNDHFYQKQISNSRLNHPIPLQPNCKRTDCDLLTDQSITEGKVVEIAIKLQFNLQQNFCSKCGSF